MHELDPIALFDLKMDCAWVSISGYAALSLSNCHLDWSADPHHTLGDFVAFESFLSFLFFVTIISSSVSTELTTAEVSRVMPSS